MNVNVTTAMEDTVVISSQLCMYIPFDLAIQLLGIYLKDKSAHVESNMCNNVSCRKRLGAKEWLSIYKKWLEKI